MQTPSSWTD